jgi:uncharacterized protein YbjQ (UPF0145 family)
MAAVLAGCATTEVVEYRAAPGQEVRVGQGGAVKVVNGMEVWMDGGAPPRQFRIIAQSTTNYQTSGTLEIQAKRNYALSQLVEEAKKRGADAVVLMNESVGSDGYVTIPGSTQTNVTMVGRTGFANSTTAPGVAAAVKGNVITAAFVKYN